MLLIQVGFGCGSNAEFRSVIVPCTCIKIHINSSGFHKIQKPIQRRINIGFDLIVLEALIARDIASFSFHIHEVVELCAQLLRNIRKSPVWIRINISCADTISYESAPFSVAIINHSVVKGNKNTFRVPVDIDLKSTVATRGSIYGLSETSFIHRIESPRILMRLSIKRKKNLRNYPCITRFWLTME